MDIAYPVHRSKDILCSLLVLYQITLLNKQYLFTPEGYKGRHSELASIVTLGSSLDYSTSRSSLRLLLPLVSQKKHILLLPTSKFLKGGSFVHSSNLTRRWSSFTGRSCTSFECPCCSIRSIHGSCFSSCILRPSVLFVLVKPTGFCTKHDATRDA